MKKIICISLCVLLCVPLLAFSAFADDSSFYFVYPSGNILNSANISVDGVYYTVYNEPALVTVSSNNTLTLSSPNVLSYDGNIVSNDSNSPTVVFVGDTITVDSSFSSSSAYYIVLVERDPFAPVNEGVSSFIGFGGDVLRFITNNSAILTLLGLSVALCVVIPFGITKIKELVKGY